jgi:hypothetical protein
MAWPVNARYETLTANISTIKKALLDALQDAIIGIYGGARSIKFLNVDGTGDQASTATGAGGVNTVLAGGVLCGTLTASTLLESGGNADIDGDVNVLTGKLVVGGTVSGDSGDGLVKAKRYYSTGTALVAGDFTLVNWGGSPAVTVGGTDTAFYINIVAGMGAAGVASVQLTFKDGTFTTAPIAIVQFAHSTDLGTVDPTTTFVRCRPATDITATTLFWDLPGVTVTNGATYSFIGHIIGR